MIASIQERQAKGLALNAQSVVVDDEKMIGAARRLFGGWKAALEAAGIDPKTAKPQQANRRPHGYWDKRRVLEHLRELQTQGVPLNAHSVQLADGGLEATAKRLFGSFEAAIEALGLDYADVRITDTWTPERVIGEIQRAYAIGSDLSDNTVSTLNPPLYGAAQTHCGGWKQAIEAAGIDSESTRRTEKWTREKLISYFTEAMQVGLHIPTLLHWEDAYRGTILRYFKSTAEFYEALGIVGVQKETTKNNQLRIYRLAKELSQTELGRRIGYSHRAISMYELGQLEPSLAVALKLASALGVSVEDIWG